MKNVDSLEIDMSYIEKGLTLIVDEKVKGTLFISEDFEENLEAKYQLRESFSYDYEFNNSNFSFIDNQVAFPHARRKHIGIISTNSYVGTLKIPVAKNNTRTNMFLDIEVQSLKTDYRTDYRDMLEFITEQCVEILLHADSPVYKSFKTSLHSQSKSLYQRFSFIKSIIHTDDFTEAIYRILSAPYTKWGKELEEKDIRRIRKFTKNHLYILSSRSLRSILPKDHSLSKLGISSSPQKISEFKKTDIVDTHENRFVKYVLQSLFRFCEEMFKTAVLHKYETLKRESLALKDKIEVWLQHSLFKDISKPTTLNLNSPVLQRKEGYREVLRVWLMFELAADLVWSGGDDVYSSGKKDLAILYEYWLFFKLSNLFENMFSIPKNQFLDLIEKTSDGLNLKLKQGKNKIMEGLYDSCGRKLKIRFHYNRFFSGKKCFPNPGSWTINMRPDYTLSIWPYEICETEAEKQELIVHIHFDAKYKLSSLKELLDNANCPDLEKVENRDGIYKNVDLLKMHAYKDAIRRTGGAYILYPGNIKDIRTGFHEVIPGLGAFPIKPSKTEDGTSELKNFVLNVLNHFCNRISHRERIAYRTYEIYNDNKGFELKEKTPEPYGTRRNLIPSDTYVLVAYYRKENWEWILKNNLYNARAGNNRGALRLGLGESTAKYILLHCKNELITSKLLKVIEDGPRILSKQQILEKGYPKPTQPFYLVYKVTDKIENELKNTSWDIRGLPLFRDRRGSSLPFSVSLAELMRAKVK